MSRKRKKKSLPPQHKRMKRPARLQAARAWLAKYPGKNVVAGYRKHFAVNAFCALIELQRLGVRLDPEYVERVRSSEQSRIEARRRERERRKAASAPAEFGADSWEEMGGLQEMWWGQDAEDDKPPEEIPF